VSSWLATVEQPGWSNLITEILTDSRTIGDAERLLKGSPARPGVVQVLRDKYIERQLAALNPRLANPDLTDAEKIETLNEIQTLRSIKKQAIL
jgi:hypothetical protein